MKIRQGDQPLPDKSDRPSIQSLVIEDIHARELVGIERYGTPMQPFNGRDVLRDLYEELLDGAMYVRQCMVEREEGEDPNYESAEQFRRIMAIVTRNSRAKNAFAVIQDELAKAVDAR